MSDDKNLNPLQGFTAEFTLAEVDNSLLELLTGQKIVDGQFTSPAVQADRSLTLYAPVKRTFWQWLTRKPRQYRTLYFPNVWLEQPETEED